MILPPLVVPGRDITFLTCLGHLGWHDMNMNDPICVVLPKVAKASTVVTVECRCHCQFC
jgi:hypothetical protein